MFQLFVASIVAVAGLLGAASVAQEEAVDQQSMNQKLSSAEANFAAIQATLDTAESQANILCPAIR